ncbi:hypothetical protein BH10PSE18_BH10PSE18_15230 [soil metagenome]
MAFAEDPTVFLDEFADDVQLGDELPTRAIFDAASERGDVGPLGMASIQPVLRMPVSAMPALVDGAPVVVGGDLVDIEGVPSLVGGASYLYRGQEPDGTGWTVIYLEKVKVR